MLLTSLMMLALLAAQQQQISPWAAAQPANAPPLARESDCQDAAKRAEGESEGGCIMRFRRMGPTMAGDFEAYAAELRGREEARREAEAPADFDTAFARSRETQGETAPEWAFSDPARWERSQCGAEPEEACLRSARNRLAMARVDQVETEEPASGPAVRPESRCRNIWRRAEDGVGGSFTRVCGDGDGEESVRTLENLRRGTGEGRQDADRDCHRRPETTDLGVRWTLVCGSERNRERANDALDAVMN